ncbi:MAG: BON domain-containing protein [Myxococcota bacterium]
MGPRGYRRSDERIHDDVVAVLTAHPDVDASEMEVVVREGEVTLLGAAPDKLTARLAEDAASRVRGVTQVFAHLSYPPTVVGGENDELGGRY